jgi:hypothetical protein
MAGAAAGAVSVYWYAVRVLLLLLLLAGAAAAVGSCVVKCCCCCVVAGLHSFDPFGQVPSGTVASKESTAEAAEYVWLMKHVDKVAASSSSCYPIKP